MAINGQLLHNDGAQSKSGEGDIFAIRQLRQKLAIAHLSDSYYYIIGYFLSFQIRMTSCHVVGQSYVNQVFFLFKMEWLDQHCLTFLKV